MSTMEPEIHPEPEPVPDRFPVWYTTVDAGLYTAWVVYAPGSDGYKGILRVRRNSDNEVISEQEVSISYAARFGPDVYDVYHWQDLILEAVDADYAAKAKAHDESENI